MLSNVTSCVIVLYFFPTSLFTEWVCVYAYTEPLGQHAGISELFLIVDSMYDFFSTEMTLHAVSMQNKRGQVVAQTLFH